MSRDCLERRRHAMIALHRALYASVRNASVRNARVLNACVTACLLGALVHVPLAAQRGPSQGAPMRVRPNDNRIAAGVRTGNAWKLALEARLSDWRPHGDGGAGVTVPAFAVVGGAPRIPGPLLRVTQGSTVTVSVRNTLPTDTLRVYGLYDRPLASAADSVPLVLARGDQRTVTFRLDAAGTYYYWGTTTRRALAFRTGLDAQLTGAVVVDPPGKAIADRIFVIGMWTDTVARSFLPRRRVLGVVNGRSWPNTEPLAATVGDSVRWRVINASGDLHPMQLHGFYFRLTSRGDGTTDTLFTAERSPLEVTEAAAMGATFAMTWVPERAGNWLFHCHIPEHFEARGPLGLPRDTAGRATSGHGSHANDGMSGMVLGVVVGARKGARAVVSASTDTKSPRVLRLLVRPTVGSSAANPTFAYALNERGVEPPADSGLVAAPPLVLTRGEPVEITVVNRLAEPTAVHWHGIELESYYDGVPGFSGSGRKLAPLVAPGDSFVVRFTPPRAGTFIYHTHHDENRQQAAGLAGPIIVLEPGQQFDPVRDQAVLLSSPADQREAAGFVLLNARREPTPVSVRVGDTLRLRIVNMTLRRSGLRVRLMRGDSAVAWRVIAKDGTPVPSSLSRSAPDNLLVSIGETMDVEVTSRQPGDLRMQVRVGPLGDARVLGSYPIRFTP